MAQNKRSEYYKNKSKKTSSPQKKTPKNNSENKNITINANADSKINNIINETINDKIVSFEKNDFENTSEANVEKSVVITDVSTDKEEYSFQKEEGKNSFSENNNQYSGAFAFLNLEQEINSFNTKQITDNNSFQEKIQNNENKTKEEKKEQDKLEKEKYKELERRNKELKKEANKNKKSILKEKPVKILMIIFSLIVVVCLALYFINFYNQKKMDDVLLQFDNINKSNQILTKEELDSYKIVGNENSNVYYKEVDFKVKLDVPTSSKGYITVNNIPAISTKPYLYEFSVTQQVGTDNLVMFEFFVYDQKEYDALPVEMKERYVMVKKFESENKCLAYRQYPHNLSGNKEAFDDYMKFYREIDYFISSFQLIK